ncbi:MAG: hypothetical protein GX896_07600, partial [Clostridiales bacterium]|nr:hypothetical protein [Clostridiales bacterium]
MKKILSIILSLAMVATMSITAFATVVENPNDTGNTNLGEYKGIITINNIDDLNQVYEKWQTTTDYDNYQLITVLQSIAISNSYDFTKDNGAGLLINCLGDVTINENATIKAVGVMFLSQTINNGKIILTQAETAKGGLCSKYIIANDGLVNNGTISMLNTDKVVSNSTVEGKYPITNNGTIQTPTGKIVFDNSGVTNANGDVYINPASTGTIKKLPQIKNPDTTGATDLTMSGVAITAPTYTVTIPTTIDFGTCDKAMANDTAKNRIKEITVDGLTITHSNLFVNEKQITIAMGSDFTIKNGANTLNFDLYDGTT